MVIEPKFLLSLCGTQLCHLLFSCLYPLIMYVQSTTAVGGGKIGSRAVQIILLLILGGVDVKQFLESTLSQTEGLFYIFKITRENPKLCWTLTLQ